MAPIEIEISEKLNEYVQKLVDDGNFESVEAFAKHAIYWLSELYGFGEQYKGKSLSKLLSEIVGSKAHTPKTTQETKIEAKPVAKSVDIPNKDLIIESYSSSKFMFEDAIFAACQFAALKQGNPPISKEEFTKSLDQMAEAGILSKIEKGDKTMWKRNE
jgi:predicted transcriptional regulator